jgi:predicted GH43/DUF377 family glycosyl hydrolase
MSLSLKHRAVLVRRQFFGRGAKGCVLAAMALSLWCGGLPLRGAVPLDAAGAAALAGAVPMLNVNLNNRKYHGNPVLRGGAKGEWDERGIGRVAVIRVGREDWRLWYSGQNAAGRVSLGLATSRDGIRWTKHPGNPVLEPSEPWEGSNLSPTSVVQAEGKFHLYYWGPGHLQPPKMKYIGLAVSEDGIRWTRQGAVDGHAGAVLGPEPEILNEAAASGGSGVDAAKVFLLREERKWLMIFTGFGRHGQWNGLAESADGIRWNKTRAPIAPVGGLLNRMTGDHRQSGQTLRSPVRVGSAWVALDFHTEDGAASPAVALSPDQWFSLGNRILFQNQDYEPGRVAPVSIEAADEWFHIYYAIYGGRDGASIGLVRAPLRSVRQPLVFWEDEAVPAAGRVSMVIEPDARPLALHFRSDREGELRFVVWNPGAAQWAELPGVKARANEVISPALPSHAKLRLRFTPVGGPARVSAWAVPE